jgi:hypothetical protein
MIQSSPSRRAGLELHRIRAVLGLGQRERADRLDARHRLEPAVALLVGAEHVDRLHGEVRVHAEERPHAAVGARPLHAHEAGRGRAHARAAVPLDDAAGEAELGDLRDELERKLGALPVVVDDRRDLARAEVVEAIADRALFVGEQLVGQVQIGGRGHARGR